jgi:hypothetical protein
MNQILFITFYGVYDYILDICDTFEQLNVGVYSFPLKKYEKNKKMTIDMILHELIEMIQCNHITHIFFFYIPKSFETYLVHIKKFVPGIKYVFYNFDDHMSFNKDLLKFGYFMDYFINPIKKNEKKYTLLLGKKIYTLEKYFYPDLLLDKPKNSVVYDLIIIVNQYECHDETEKLHILKIIDQICHYSKINNYSIKLFGTYQLKDYFQSIYKKEIDYLTERKILHGGKVIILLDYRNTMNKTTNDFIIHSHVCQKKIITNYHIIHNDMIKRHSNIHLLDINNLDLIKSIYESNYEECPECQVYNIQDWVKAILCIIN